MAESPPTPPGDDSQGPTQSADGKCRTRLSRRRRWLRRALVFCLVFLILLVALVLFVPVLVGSGWVRRLAQSQASAALGAPVEIGSIGFGWGGRFELRGLRVAEAEGKQMALEVDLLRARWGWKPLASGRVGIDECLAQGVRARIVRRADGSLNLPTPPARPSTSKPKTAAPGRAAPMPTDLPIDRLHVSLRDWRVEFVDHAAPLPTDAKGPLRVAVEMAELAVDLDEPGAPLQIAGAGALALGDGATSAPWSWRLLIEPGARGLLDWQSATVRFDGRFPASQAEFLCEPMPGGGLQATARVALEAGLLERLALGGIGLPPAADLRGALATTLDAQWPDGGAPRIALRAGSMGLSAAPGALNGERVSCEIAGAIVALGPPTPLGHAPDMGGWRVRIPDVRVRVPSVDFGLDADASLTSPGALPRVEALVRLAHRPGELAPYLSALGVELPADAGRVKSVEYRATLACDGATSATLSGELGIGLGDAGWGRAGSVSLALVLPHEARYDIAADRAQLSAFMAEAAEGPEAVWWALESRAGPVAAKPRRATAEIMVYPPRAAQALAHYGLAPDVVRTSGSLALSLTADETNSGGLSLLVGLRGAIDAALRSGSDSVAPQLAEALDALQLRLSDARALVLLDGQTGAVDVETQGTLEVRGGWRGDVGAAAPLVARAHVPIGWSARGGMARGGAARFDGRIDATPRVRLAGAYTLDVAQGLAVSARGDMDAQAGTYDLAELTMTLGGWLRAGGFARLAQGGQVVESSRLDVAFDWGRAMMAWTPEEIAALLGDFDPEGRTSLRVEAKGASVPGMPGDPLSVNFEAAHHFASLKWSRGDGAMSAEIEDLRVSVAGQVPNLLGGTIAVPDLRIDARAERMGAPGLLGLSGLRVGVRSALDGAVGRAAWDMEAGSDEVRLVDVDALTMGPVVLAARGSGGAGVPMLDIERFDCSVGDAGQGGELVGVSGLVGLTSPTGLFRVRADIDVPSVEGVGRRLQALASAPLDGAPAPIGEALASLRQALSRVPPTMGSVRVRLSGQGHVPSPADLAARRFPFQADYSLAVRDFATTVSEPIAVSVRGLSTDLTLGVSGDTASLEMNGGLDGLRYGGEAGFAAPGVRWRGSAQLNVASGALEWPGWLVEAPDWGLGLRLAGSAQGLGRLASPASGAALPVSIQEALGAAGIGSDGAVAGYADAARTMGFRNLAELNWRGADWLALPVGQARLRGAARLAVRALQEPGREVQAELSAEFSDLAFESEGLAVDGLDGSLRLVMAGRRLSERASMPGYASRLTIPYGEGYRSGPSGRVARVLAPARPEQTSSLRIEGVRAGPWVARDMELASQGDLRDWALAFSCSDLMGGQAHAQLHLREGREEASAWTIGMDGAFTGVSARSALETWRNLPAEETELNGVFRFQWEVPRRAESPLEMLRGVQLRVTITRIGKGALQAFLAALDPQGRNPSFVSARQALRYGRPDSVHFLFQHGLIDMEVRVTTFARTWDMQLLDRAPVGEVTRLDSLRPQLEALRFLRIGLDLLAGLDQWVDRTAAAGPTRRPALARMGNSAQEEKP